MVYGLWLSAAGLQANQYHQDLLANNLANVETAGFKRDLAVFAERQIEAREGLHGTSASQPLLGSMTGGTFVAPTYTVFEQGPTQVTERALDVALVGDGFLTVREGDRTLYTRDGRLTVNAAGELVTVAGGRPVLNAEGTPVRVPVDRISELRIGQDGRVNVGSTEIGRLGVVDFEDPTSLRKIGGNLFEAPQGAALKPATATLQSGAFETSGVDPMTTMVAMIEASRAYQFNATLISMQDSMMTRAANDIARVR
jgi:flagellar basal body rod protein FlgG